MFNIYKQISYLNKYNYIYIIKIILFNVFYFPYIYHALKYLVELFLHMLNTLQLYFYHYLNYKLDLYYN